ncbi:MULTISPECIES: M23 family metallopeptidase [Deefgea]|uniref:Peptidoglycan DD-metalloendopeptidase family protein n=1 Tax=Deefgea chitinilytica TaxID=570276 RepID=A0ABS2C9B8_9NEIS|nr:MULTISPECIES: peptidoglycan DD-metalloendopeptidase family protein [Deefgea]MBM5570751.1 peptidoglycan DD-metalloendopeptidase family protein [Deefgea chitinilytica]MBM9887980.1 peptidoglycan DD-metalloendopeptidase family protein [Deefgea sp. CFH1-16]
MSQILPQTHVDGRENTVVSNKASWQQKHIAWLAAALALPITATMTAYGVVEYGPRETVQVSQVTQELATPILASASSNAPFWREEIIQTGDGLGKLFSKLAINDLQAWDFVRTDPAARALYELSAGRAIQAKTTPDGRLLELSYLNRAGDLIQIVREGEQLRTHIAPAIAEKKTEYKTGTIHSSFYAATDAVGLPDAIAQQLIDAFEGKIDFHHSLKKGDQFSVIYETERSGGEVIRTGKILAAQFINKGQTHEVIWFEGNGATGAYYDAAGNSTAQSFLASPVKFSRISSGFSMRFHPVLFTWKSHKGIDYAAPTGTPVLSTADGVVTRVEQDSGYGKFVEVKHGDQYSTLYGHLSAYAKDLKVGQAVKQGDTLGAVGQTGRATGPHLHYEFKTNGKQVDPLTVKLPNSKPLNATQMAAFKPFANSIKQQLALLNRVELAQID